MGNKSNKNGNKMNNILTKELIKTIFGSLGMVPGENFGKLGISTKEFLTKEEIQVMIESEDMVFSVFAGKAIQENSQLDILITPIIVNNYWEFNAVYRVDQYNIHAIKTAYYDENNEVPDLFIYKLNNKWKKLNLFNQLLSCAGFVKMTDKGTEFRPVKEIDSGLLESLHQLIEL